MKKDLVIFGVGKIADVIYYYAKEECGYNVVAFTVDAKFVTDKTFNGLPVIPFEGIDKTIYSSDKCDMFVAVGYHDLNKLRAAKCDEAVKKGFQLVSVISPLANVPKNVTVGKNCFIMSPSLIHPCVILGDNVFVWSGSVIGHHSSIKNNCWITSGSNVGGNVTLGENSFLAINSTIGHSVTLGKECFIGANALVTKNMEDQKVIIAESQKPIKLNSQQFLRMSNFSSL